MEHETLNLANCQWVRVEQTPDKFVLMTGAEKLFMQDTDQGAMVQGVDKDGVATIARFKTARCDDLTIKAKLLDPNRPAGVMTSPSSTSAQTTAVTQQTK